LPYEQVGKNAPVCIADEVPFEIPDTWEWVRFCNVVNYSMGKTPPRKESEYWNNPIHNWVSIADMVSDGHISETKEGVSAYAADVSFKGRKSPAGTLLMSFKLTVGKVSILDIDAFHNEAIISIYPFVDDNKIMTSYLFAVMPLLSQLGETKTAIKGNTLNSDSLDSLWIPLPPLNEQDRICSKLKELLPVLSNYSELEQEIKILNLSFPEKLKKSILQEAVQGKLVPQDENDEPASVLLERIRAEKQALIKAGKIKRDKNESVIFRRDNSHYEKRGSEVVCIDDEIPFEIPNSWEWVRLKSICTKLVDGDHNPPKGETFETQYIMASSTNINNNRLVELNKVRYLSKEVFEQENLRTNATTGDLFFTSVGSLGRSCVYEGGYNVCFQRSVSVITTLIYNYYLKLVFDSAYFQNKAIKEATGTAQKGFYLNQLAEMLIPVPPMSEQQRIVDFANKVLSTIEAL